jgi:HlyD family secretion protein
MEVLMKSITQHKRILILPLVLVVLVAIYLIIRSQTAGDGKLQASGTVEAVEVSLAPEISGKVAEIFADKGQSVKQGEPLLRLDSELLQAQREQATSALDTALANQITSDTGLASAETAVESAEAALAAARYAAIAERLPVQKALDDLNINAPAVRGEAARNVASANRAVRDAEYLLFNYNVSSLQKDLTPSEGLSITLKLLNEARQAFEPYRYESEYDDRREELKEALDEAQSEYDSAVRRIELEAGLEAAQSKLRKAEEDLSKLQNGPDPQEVAILEARLAAIDAVPIQAETALQGAVVGVESARSRVNAAKSATAQARAALDLIDLQLEKLTIASPIDGVVLNRVIETGEVVQAGATVMTVGRLSPLKIVVYLPEDRYGEVKLGQTAYLKVDSYPGQDFLATIVSIADQAEFTPRNVQTAEGRRNTVFAIELAVANPDLKLKPGMPADVAFE